MALRLNANKTKFYNLAKLYYPDIEPCKKVEFIKYTRVRDYALDFWAGDYYHHLFLSLYADKACLGDSWSTYDDDGIEIKHWECHDLDLDELRKFDLLEEVPNK